MPDVWLLYRSKEFPRVGEFDTEEAAIEFRDEHLLIDWTPLKIKHRLPDLFDGQEHTQVCSACGEDWPCRVERLERQARNIAHMDRYKCQKCGGQTTWVRITVPGADFLGGDAVYCGKLGACRTQAMKELLRLGHVDLHAKYERERQQRSDELARRKARKQHTREVWRAGMEAVAREEEHSAPS